MSEAPDDYQERLQAARLQSLVAETGVRMSELAILLSAFESVVRGVQLMEKGGVPSEERPGVPDPQQLLAKEDDMTTGEAVDIWAQFLDMSAEGKARLWDLLGLTFVGDD